MFSWFYFDFVCLYNLPFFLAGHFKLDNRVVFRTMHTVVIVGMLVVAFVLLNIEHAVSLQGTHRYTFIHTYIYTYINKYIHTFKFNFIPEEAVELKEDEQLTMYRNTMGKMTTTLLSPYSKKVKNFTCSFTKISIN